MKNCSVAHEITLKCNLNCSFCYQKSFREKSRLEELPFEDIKKIYDKFDINSISLVGSEIFMHKEIFDILNYLDSRNIEMQLSTNGTLLTDSSIEKLKNIKSIKSIGLSIDGCEEVHNKIRGSNIAFQKTIDAINKLKDNFRVGITLVLNADNLKENININLTNINFEGFSFPDEIQQTKEILEKEFGWKDFDLAVYEKQEHDYTLEQLEKAKTITAKFSSKPAFTNTEEYYNGTLRENHKLICPKLLKPCFRIDHEGNVLHCSNIRKSFGNLLEKTPEEIYNSKEYTEFRKKLEEINLLPICSRCCKVEFR